LEFEVAIIQRRLTHYRVPLFGELRQSLAARGIGLRVLHGDPADSELCKQDSGSLAWAEHLQTRYLGSERLCWQPYWSRVDKCALVIVSQENKLINNLPALLRRPAGSPLLAFWGHGRNMQAEQPDGWPERFKRWSSRRVDWWFAYTQLSAQTVQAAGFPADRVTVLDNSIDTEALRRAIQTAAQTPPDELRARFGFGPGPLAVFIGSLYIGKRIPFLLEAAAKLRALIPGFQLAIAGEGPKRVLVAAAAAKSGGSIHYLGAVHGRAKAELLAGADIMLNPGLVGLGILDAFAAGVPMATTDCGLHSPEIVYLDNGRNGLMTGNSLEAYVAQVAETLADAAALKRMGKAALASAERYSLARTTANFTSGIQACIARGRPD
jgi:glycosyltransferase involved in cell wall biosynthesis